MCIYSTSNSRKVSWPKGWNNTKRPCATTFNLNFTYVLADWEGSTHDSYVLNDALSRQRELKIPEDIIGLESDFIIDTSFRSDFFSFFTINA